MRYGHNVLIPRKIKEVLCVCVLSFPDALYKIRMRNTVFHIS